MTYSPATTKVTPPPADELLVMPHELDEASFHSECTRLITFLKTNLTVRCCGPTAKSASRKASA